MKTCHHFIDGQYVEPLSARWFDSVDPYRGEVWAKIPQGCAQDVDRAVAAAKTMKRVTLELGGKLPNIVVEDCDLDQAASGAISGIFAATGQTCIVERPATPWASEWDGERYPPAPAP